MKPARVFDLRGVVCCPCLVLILYSRDTMGIHGLARENFPQRHYRFFSGSFEKALFRRMSSTLRHNLRTKETTAQYIDLFAATDPSHKIPLGTRFFWCLTADPTPIRTKLLENTGPGQTFLLRIILYKNWNNNKCHNNDPILRIQNLSIIKVGGWQHPDSSFLGTVTAPTTKVVLEHHNHPFSLHSKMAPTV